MELQLHTVERAANMTLVIRKGLVHQGLHLLCHGQALVLQPLHDRRVRISSRFELLNLQLQAIECAADVAVVLQSWNAAM